MNVSEADLAVVFDASKKKPCASESIVQDSTLCLLLFRESKQVSYVTLVKCRTKQKKYINLKIMGMFFSLLLLSN